MHKHSGTEWGAFQALTAWEFMSEITKQNTPAIPVRGTYRNSSPTLSDFGQHSFTIHSNNTRVAEHGVTLKAHSSIDWGKSTMKLGGIRKLTVCEFTTEITTNSRQRCVSEVHVSTQHSSQTLSEFDSVYTSKFTATTHATLSLAKQCKFVC